MNERNIFIALADALWARGDEGEDLARELALAFHHIARQGIDPHRKEDIVKEFDRFLTECEVK